MAQAQTLTTKQLQAGFGVGHMTIYNWRAGSAKREALPAHVDAQKRVTFKLGEVKAWAKEYGLTFTAPTGEAEVVKPGPKPTAIVAAKKAAKAENAVGKKQADAAIDATEATKKANSKLATVAEIHVAGTQTGRISGKTPAKSNPPKVAAKKVAADKPGKLARAIGAHAKATENKKAKPAAQPAA